MGHSVKPGAGKHLVPSGENSTLANGVGMSEFECEGLATYSPQVADAITAAGRRYCPSGENATLYVPLRPIKRSSSAPDTGSQSRAVLSRLPVTIR